ncbi:hypothetical protein PRIPAC_96567 [Pristionchus pacificus]|uniref:Jmjd-1.2 n=1 Tax=Pristionchus pacificus TaxID=54126 RepID=A0A2A6BD04_PRIPA|nr:hypothetical protein PRIPAC_96567 [Pristionchus pacificus]|eukprot:PDM63763.1 jmjd-1.2 [Pristionchus pacificus]
MTKRGDSHQLSTPARAKPAPEPKSSKKKAKTPSKTPVKPRSVDRPNDKRKCRVCHDHHPLRNDFPYEKIDFDRSDVAWLDFIDCEECKSEFHLGCIRLEPFKKMLIATYVCAACEREDRRTTMKTAEELGETTDAIEDVGSQNWIKNFLRPKEFASPPAAASQEEFGLRVIEDGRQFEEEFNKNSTWNCIFLIKSKKDLGIQVPQKPFGMKELIALMGVDTSQWLESVIDVTAQVTTRMLLSTFSELFNLDEGERERVYNILSLEYSKTGLAGIVIPPEIYRTLSLADRYWPLNGESAEKCETKHLDMRPAVERFVLIGMGGSYTDFHIDFGGSSVWYHVFQGQKVFYVAPPTPKNLQIFEGHQNGDQQKTVFLGDRLEGCSRVVIRSGQTLFVPSGWVHAVYTPMDSIVFGGNFLTLQGMQMQIEIQKMDTRLELGNEFGYPYFDTVMFYTALTLSKQLKEHCEKRATGSEDVFPYLDGAVALVEYLKEADKEVTSKKQSPSKFARGLSKKDIVEQLEEAVKMAKENDAAEDQPAINPKKEVNEETEEGMNSDEENMNDTEENTDTEFDPDQEEEDEEDLENKNGHDNKDEKDKKKDLLEDDEEKQPIIVKAGNVLQQNRDQGNDEFKKKIVRSENGATISADRDRPMKRGNADDRENERIKRQRTGGAPVDITRITRTILKKENDDEEDERTRRAIEEEKKAEMERKVAAAQNRMEQLFNNPRPTIQVQLEVPGSLEQDAEYIRIVNNVKVVRAEKAKLRAAIAREKEIEEEQKIADAEVQMARELQEWIEQERNKANQLMEVHVQAFLADQAVIMAADDDLTAAAAGDEGADAIVNQ